MKKVIVFLFVGMSIFLYLNTDNGAAEVYVLPIDSIRMRVIANSDDANDQIIKYDLINNITDIIENIENNSSSSIDSKEVILESIPLIEDKLLEFGISGTVSYGDNYFPVKTYKSVTYDEGNYESLVITIGSGLGENWWCVLFPPLCLIEANESDLSDIEYSFYVKNIIESYF